MTDARSDLGEDGMDCSDKQQSVPVAESHEESGARMRVVLLLENDLFFGVRIADTLKHAGFRVISAPTFAKFAQAMRIDVPDVAMVNCAIKGQDWQEALRFSAAVGVASVAYAPHVEADLQSQARAAGATVVIANSRLAGDLVTVVTRAMRKQGGLDATAANATLPD